MDKSNFTFKASPYGSGTYVVETEGFEIEIPEAYFSDEKILFAEKLIAVYPTKLFDLARFCVKSDCFKECYPGETVATTMEKLHFPTVKIDNVGGIFTYCNHELDDNHLIDVEFVGLMESFFSVNIDG